MFTKQNTMNFAAAWLALAVIGGCSTTAPRPHGTEMSQSANLALPSEQLLELATTPSDQTAADVDAIAEHWAFSRNDDQLGSEPWMGVAGPEFLEVRHREYLRTINGRPREFSTTATRTIKRGVTY